MKQPQQFSPYFVAKCFAAYYNSPAYLDGKTIGVLGTTLDNIIHFGQEGWRLKLWPIYKLQPDHARSILSMRTGKDLTTYKVTVDVLRDASTIMVSAENAGHVITDTIQYGPGATYTTAEAEYYRGFHYDIGFSYLHSLIEAELAVDASELNEGPFWSQARAPRTFRHDYLDGLALLAKYAAAHQSPEHVGILNALIGAELGGNTNELFVGMAAIIRKLRKDSDEEYQKTNN